MTRPLRLAVPLLALAACTTVDVHPSTVVGNPGKMTAASADDASTRRMSVSLDAATVHACDPSQSYELRNGAGEPLAGELDLAQPVDFVLQTTDDVDKGVCGISLSLDAPVLLELLGPDGEVRAFELDVDEIVLSAAEALERDRAVVLELGFPRWVGASLSSSPGTDAVLAERLADASGLFEDVDEDGTISDEERAAGAFTGVAHPAALGAERGVVVVGEGGAIGRLSLDGTDWLLAEPGGVDDQVWETVAAGPTGAVAAGGLAFEADLAGSADLRAWEPIPVVGSQVSDLAFGGGRYVGVGLGNQVLTSVDGQSWDRVLLSPSELELYGVAYGEGRFVAGGQIGDGQGVVLWSRDGLVWSEPVFLDAPKLLALAHDGEGTFVAVGRDGYVGHSEDGGESFTPHDIVAGTVHLDRVRWVHDRFVVPRGLELLESVDGVSWEDHSIGTPIEDIAWTGEVVVGINGGGGVFHSTDRRSWVQVDGAADEVWRAVVARRAP